MSGECFPTMCQSLKGNLKEGSQAGKEKREAEEKQDICPPVSSLRSRECVLDDSGEGKGGQERRVKGKLVFEFVPSPLDLGQG